MAEESRQPCIWRTGCSSPDRCRDSGFCLASVRETGGAQLLETHAKALEGYCMENARLREAIQWVVRDAAYKAPEQMGPAMAARWIDRLRSALEGSAVETDDDDALYCEQDETHGPLQAAVCLGCWNKLAQEVIELRKQVRPAVETSGEQP